jgi:hypothetical protein
MPTQKHQLHSILMIVATVALGFSLFIYVLYAINLIQFPFDYDQGEGFEVYDTVLFSQGQLPYRDTEAYPFYSSNYPPLFHIMAVPFVWFFGEGYWYGRLLSFLSTLITAGTIGYAVYRDGHKQRWIAILSGLAFLASNMVYHVGPLVRQHMMMVMFETLAVVIFAKAYPQKNTKQIALGFFLLICAGYTKQLAAITAVAVIGWMFLHNPKRTILWTIGFGVAGGLIFIWLNIASEGQWWIQAIVANVNEFKPFQAFGLFTLWFKLHGFLLIPAGLMVAYEMYFDRFSIYSIWFVISALLGGIGSGTWGAGDSYFTTSIATMCILSGIYFSRTLTHSWKLQDNYIKRIMPSVRFTGTGLIIIPLLYLGYGRATLKMPTDGVFSPIAQMLNVSPNVRDNFFDSATFDVLGYANIGYFLSEVDTQAGYQIVELIQNTDTLIMSEEAGFTMVAGRDVVTNPTQLRNLYLAGLYNGSQLIDTLNNQEFGLIILRAQFYPTPVLEAMGQNYEITETILMNGFEYLILRPMSSDETDS